MAVNDGNPHSQLIQRRKDLFIGLLELPVGSLQLGVGVAQLIVDFRQFLTLCDDLGGAVATFRSSSLFGGSGA